MNAKTLFAASALAAALLASVPAQAAGLDVTIGLGVPVYPAHSYQLAESGMGGGHGPRHFRREFPRFEPRFVRGISCREGKFAVMDAGFRAVEENDCDGRTYNYFARRNHRNFLVTVSRFSGEIVSVQRVR